MTTQTAAAVQTETEVRLHAFTSDADGDHYADFDPANPDLRWTAFTVTRAKGGDVLDMLWEEDFDSHAAALAAARKESLARGLSPDDVREY